jgi:hypothetical protein
MNDDQGWPAGVLLPADRERFARYAEALAFFEGEQWLGRRRRGETRLTINYARALLRKVASYVFPAPVTFSVELSAISSQLSAATGNRAERALAEVIAANDLAQMDLALCVEASVLGDAAVKVTWDVAAGRPAVAAVDPGTLVVACAPDNPRRMVRVTQAYRLSGEAIASLFGAESLAAERMYPVVETWTDARWVVEIAGQRVRDEANPYGWIPYVIAANNPRPHAFWGESDLVDLFDLCRELNARMSVLSRVLELSGAPIAVLENVDGSEGITVGPGAKWELPEGAKAYLLDLLSGGGVSLHVDYVQLLYRALHDLSETPRTAFGDAGRALSGAALEVEVQPLVQRVQRKRRMFDGLYRARNERLLDLLERFGGVDLGGLRRTETVWPSVLPSDQETAVRNAVSLIQSGIQSRRTAIASLGGTDPEAEVARIREELQATGFKLQAVADDG